MDATENESAIAADAETDAVGETAAQSESVSETASEAGAEPETEQAGESAAAPERKQAAEAAAKESPEPTADQPPAEDVPAPRTAEPEPAKAKKRKSAPKSKSAAGTKSLVVLRDGKVHYADEAVVVLDLDDAAHPDTDVHDVVDKLSELRDAVESPGRAEAVSLVAELIQTKAFA